MDRLSPWYGRKPVPTDPNSALSAPVALVLSLAFHEYTPQFWCLNLYHYLLATICCSRSRLPDTLTQTQSRASYQHRITFTCPFAQRLGRRPFRRLSSAHLPRAALQLISLTLFPLSRIPLNDTLITLAPPSIETLIENARKLHSVKGS